MGVVEKGGGLCFPIRGIEHKKEIWIISKVKLVILNYMLTVLHDRGRSIIFRTKGRRLLLTETSRGVFVIYPKYDFKQEMCLTDWRGSGFVLEGNFSEKHLKAC